MNKIDLLSYPLSQIETLLATWGEPAYRAKQIFTWLHKGVVFGEMSNLSKKIRAQLEETCQINLPKIAQKFVSQLDGTVKYLYELYDGEKVESVVMKYEHGNTICISTQVGCRMGCKFCASTIGGLVRGLEPSELLGQILIAQKDLEIRISNVVMMGIGEPLDNYENVLKFLHLVNDKDGLNIGYRHISLSTCGLVDKIERLAKEDLPITLSISLHGVNDEERSALMPINHKWSIAELLTACRAYFLKTGRRISFEYTLIQGKNDTKNHAFQLARLLHTYFPQDTMPVHVNLIPVNEVLETGFQKSERNAVLSFSNELEKNGINATVRRKLGADIAASCGQLRHGQFAEK